MSTWYCRTPTRLPRRNVLLRRPSLRRILNRPRCAMHISIFSSSDSDIELVKRSLPAHDCHALPAASPWRRAENLPEQQLLIIDVEAVGARLTDLLQQANNLPPLPVLLLATNNAAQLASLSAWPSARLLEVEFKPLRRLAVAARASLLLKRAYPGQEPQQRQQFDDIGFERTSYQVHQGERSVVLTQKEFALALLLFNYLNRPLSRAYLQEVVWGHEEESEVPMRTIDTHISRIRNKLNLKPDNGFRLSTVYGYGYQLERLNPTAVTAPAQ